MNSNDQFLDKNTESTSKLTSETVEPIELQPDDSSANEGKGTIGASVAGAAVGAVIGGRVAGKRGAIVGAVTGAVAGGLAGKATPDDAGDKLKGAAEDAADKVQDTAERAKPAIESTADKAKSTAINAADKVQDRAERAKPSHHQETESIEVKERVIIEPRPVVEDTSVACGTDSFSKTEVTQKDIYDYDETSEIDRQKFFNRETDQRL